LHKQRGIVMVKKRSARRVGGKTNDSQASSHDGTSFHDVRGKRRKTRADEMRFSMEVVARFFHGEVFTDFAERGSRRNFDMRGPLRRDSQAGASKRRDRHDSDPIKIDFSIDDPSQPPQRRETAGCSIAQSTGGNSSKLSGANGIRKSPWA